MSSAEDNGAGSKELKCLNVLLKVNFIKVYKLKIIRKLFKNSQYLQFYIND